MELLQAGELAGEDGARIFRARRETSRSGGTESKLGQSGRSLSMVAVQIQSLDLQYGALIKMGTAGGKIPLAWPYSWGC